LGRMTVVGRPFPAGLRRALGLVLVAGLCVAAVTVYQDAPDLPRSARAPSLAPSPATSASTGGPSAPPTSTTSARPTRTTPPSTSKPLPKGPGTTQPGVLLMASPLRDGSFDIAEIVKLPYATSSVRLGPPNLTLAGNRFANAKPVATQVQVSADNQPVLVPGGRVSRQIDIALLEPAKRIELRYTLSGITIRSIPSPAGRAVTAISPLVKGQPSDLPVVAIVSGSTVLNIQCPARSLSKQACSVGRPPRIRVDGKLPWNKALIVVQFDLPKPQ
jgi:hypothetical protein